MSRLAVDVYLQEYSSEDAIRKYTSETAGYGISYLLAHDYADVYLNAINRFLKTDRRKPLRLLEFGCGAGMNIISLFNQIPKVSVACAGRSLRIGLQRSDTHRRNHSPTNN